MRLNPTHTCLHPRVGGTVQRRVRGFGGNLRAPPPYSSRAVRAARSASKRCASRQCSAAPRESPSPCSIPRHPSILVPAATFELQPCVSIPHTRLHPRVGGTVQRRVRGFGGNLRAPPSIQQPCCPCCKVPHPRDVLRGSAARLRANRHHRARSRGTLQYSCQPATFELQPCVSIPHTRACTPESAARCNAASAGLVVTCVPRPPYSSRAVRAARSRIQEMCFEAVQRGSARIAITMLDPAAPFNTRASPRAWLYLAPRMSNGTPAPITGVRTTSWK
ncbi:hypothetical protein B0H17DRAFT_1131241 [Mycena rosella]|uniref:Uncharacterized protein n=1 Tax=Mycena rosella TaxID=1033263 RepID=A0AAD7DPB9_MYCRO|nr:hypothetical protein B0H17DRAFT_1131241 [Mycena rosella]